MGSYPMEGPGPRGFGWDYPPGTTGSSSMARATCRLCREETEVRVVRELGTGWTEPEECPKCGGEFAEEIEEFDPREEAEEARFDQARDEGRI